MRIEKEVRMGITYRFQNS